MFDIGHVSQECPPRNARWRRQEPQPSASLIGRDVSTILVSHLEVYKAMQVLSQATISLLYANPSFG